jgi:uncharacterized protein YjbI with pentapeptide repeats
MFAETELLRLEHPPADARPPISLLDLAEVLDQHKAWVESAGDAGLRADLCGVNLAHADLTGVNLQGAFLNKVNLSGADLSLANLRGASLVQADLRDTNLLGTELRGANLMGATLYGAEGIWVGRLGGTNLFDALLPESISSFDGSKAVAQATRSARFFYFLTMAACAVCWLLILLTTDSRLILDSSAVPLPHVPNFLPMSGFYLGAPLLILLLYARLHFLLLRLWGSIAALPAVFPDGNTLEKDGPWYLMGLVRRHFRWLRDTRSPISVFESVVSAILAYWLAPATLALFWVRYLVRQDFRGTLLHVASIVLLVVAATCLPILVSRALRPGDLHRPTSGNAFRAASIPLRTAFLAAILLLALSIGVIRGVPGEMPADSSLAPQVHDIRSWAAQALQLVGYRPYAELVEAAFSPRSNASESADSSGSAGARLSLNQIDLRFARGYHLSFANAKMWRANLRGAYLPEADLHGANLREGILREASFDKAQAQGVILVSVDGRSSNFASADLRNADFSYGTFSGSLFTNAKLAGGSFYSADLREARLLRADLSKTDFRDAKLAGAFLSLATMQDADFSSAGLGGANLTQAQLKGTILLDTDLRKADLRGAVFSGAIVRGTLFDGARVEGADLRGALGLTAAQVCEMGGWHNAQLDADVLAAAQSRCGEPSTAIPFAAPPRR